MGRGPQGSLSPSPDSARGNLKLHKCRETKCSCWERGVAGWSRTFVNNAANLIFSDQCQIKSDHLLNLFTILKSIWCNYCMTVQSFVLS